MDSRERVFAVLENKIPDRVPVFSFWADEKVINKIEPGVSWFDFCMKYDLDILVVDMDHIHEEIDIHTGLFKNEWGVIRKTGIERTKVPIDGPIKSMSDLKKYTPPDPTDLSRLRTLAETVKKYKKDKIICMHIHDSFNIPWYLRGGIDKLLIDYIDNPKLVKELTDITVEYYIEIINQSLKIGADIFIIGDDYAFKTGPLMSPDNFKRFIYPGLAKLVSCIKSKNSYCIKHTDGNIMPLLEMIVDTGIDALHPFEPEAGMDILKVKKMYKDRICVCGNVEVGKILSESSPVEVKEYVKDLILKVAPGGRYMLSDSNSIHSSVKPDNYLAMIAANEEYGRYPM